MSHDEPDYEINYDVPCPHCGHDQTRYRDCSTLGCEDGYIEDDEGWGGEDMCSNCHGTGSEAWCPNCGNDPRFKARQPKPEPTG